MARCLVTGGAGFIGAHVTRALLDRRHSVVVLDDLSGGFRENVDPRAHFVEGSITDVPLVERVFSEGSFDRVYHLAAYAAEGLSHFIKRFNTTNNVIGSVNLINASVNYGVKCFVFTSSIAVYGALEPPMTEMMTPSPEDSYGIAKYAVELELKATKKLFGLDYVVFRPHNVYGELQNIGDKYRNVVGIFMNQVMQGKPLSIFGDGTQTRAFTHVGDIAALIAKAPEVPEALGQVFNVGADTPCSVKELAGLVCDAMGVPDHPVLHLEERHEVKHAWSTHDRVRAVFGRQVGTTLDVGIRRMARWALSVGARESRPFEGIEIERNLPEFWTRHHTAASSPMSVARNH